MSKELASVRSRIGSVGQLGGVIGAMRGIAALRAQQSRTRLAGIRAYAEVVATALTQAVAALPEPYRAETGGRRPILVLFAAEQGFAGGFSEKIFAAVPKGCDDPVLVVGSRGARLAAGRGLAVAGTIALMSHVDELNGCCDRLYAALAAMLAERGPCPVDLVYARPVDGSRVEVERRRALPLDLEAFRAATRRPPPLTNLRPEALVAAFSLEYVIALLSEALLHAYAAENLARMQAMAAARDNIARKLEALGADERRLRQDEITEEIVELVTSTLGLSES